MLGPAAAFALVFTALAAGALLAAGPPGRRVAAVAVAAAALAAPWLIPAELLAVRAFAGLAAAWGLARVLELVRGGGFPPARRVLQVLAVVDTREVERAPPAVDGRLLARALLSAAVAGLGLWAAVRLAPGLDGAGRLAARWVGGLVFVVAAAEAADAGVRAGLRLIGLVHPAIQRAPLASLGVREFWARRWNRVVQAWLAANVFAPVARRHGPVAGLAAAFGASAVLHGYMVLAPLGAGWAAVGAGYFLVQALLVLLEARLALRRWPTPLRRAWTLGALGATSPLFVEPALRCLAI